MPYIGKSPSFGVRNRFVYLASADDTSVSGADANGATLTFTDGAYVDVYLNGVLLKTGTDYNTNTANTIAGLSALSANDEVTVVVYDIFAVADTVSATSGGTFSGNVTFNGDISVGDDLSLASDGALINFGADSEVTLTHVADTGLSLNDNLTITTADNDPQLTLISTDADSGVGPRINLNRNSSSPADDDALGFIYAQGENDADELTDYGFIGFFADDVTNGSEDGNAYVVLKKDGTNRNRINLTSTETVLNDDGQDLDFRVEATGHTHLLYVDSSNASVCIGANSSSDIADYALSGASDLVIGNTNNEQNGITIVSGASSGNSTINFSDSNSGEGRRAGHINYQHQYDEFQIYNNNVTQLLRISSVGNVIPHHYIKQTNATTAGGTFVNGTNITGYNSGNYNEMNSDDNDEILILNNYNSGGNKGGLKVQHANDTSNTTSKYFLAVNSTGTKAVIFGNGDFDSATNSYGATSDERLKSNIVDAKSQWDDIKNIKFKNFKKHDTSDLVQLGVIAQEVEKTSPSLISEHEPSKQDITHDSSLGTLYTETDKDNGDIPDGRIVGDVKEVKEKVKGVKYSVLYMKAVKALQEAMTRIETLEAKVKTLEEA